MLSQDLYVELPFFSYYSCTGTRGSRLRADIEEIGSDRCIVSTDFGQWTNPPPAEGMRMAIAAMLDAGMSRGLTSPRSYVRIPSNALGLTAD